MSQHRAKLALEELSIRGFRSIKSVESFGLTRLNVLIGANGAGKSNFVEFFGLMRAVAEGSLQAYVHARNGTEELFFLGSGDARTIEIRLRFEDGLRYELNLAPTARGGVEIVREGFHERDAEQPFVAVRHAPESALREMAASANGAHDAKRIYEALSEWTVYHFHDTTSLARMRADQLNEAGERLRADGSNVAPFLLYLSRDHAASYALIRDSVRLIAPFFEDFYLQPAVRGGQETVRLRWTQKGTEKPFQPARLSDGTFRFICLAAALLQPELPSTVVVDEPELGLHPYALAIVADLIKTAAERTQVVISTQSPTLLDYFDLQDVVIVRRHEGHSTLQRPDPVALATWLEEYTIGELWQKNVMDGGPADE